MDAETNGPARRTRPILVGVNDSESSLAAVRWATEEAVRRELPLQLLHATPYDRPVVTGGVHGAESILARGRTVARRHADAVEVSTRLVTGAASAALVKASLDSTMLVLGLTGGGGVEEVLLGSTTLAVSGRAACPLVGVRTWPPVAAPHREIVLGIDADTEASVLEAAFSLAEQRGSNLVMVHCAGSEDPERPGSGPDWLEEQLAAARDRYPAVQVVSEVHTGFSVNTVNTLLRQAAHAEALVVGTRNRGRAARILLGSTSRGLLRHSQVPVVVIGPDVHVDEPVAEHKRATGTVVDGVRIGLQR